MRSVRWRKAAWPLLAVAAAIAVWMAASATRGAGSATDGGAAAPAAQSDSAAHTDQAAPADRSAQAAQAAPATQSDSAAHADQADQADQSVPGARSSAQAARTASAAQSTSAARSSDQAARSAQTAKPAFAAEAVPTEDAYYYDVLRLWRSKGYEPAEAEVQIAAASFAAASADADVEAAPYRGKAEALVWRSEAGWVEYDVVVPEPGLYALQLEYFPLPEAEGGSVAPVLIGAAFDGGYAFREARSAAFERAFADRWPLAKDERGNEILPMTDEIEGWKTKTMRDAEGAYGEPLQWYLQAGAHKLRLYLRDEPVALGSVALVPPEAPPPYAKPDAEAAEADGSREAAPIVIEAERLSAKSDTSILLDDIAAANVTPASYETIRYNIVGGLRWYRGDQTIRWTVDVPEDGNYRISFHGRQNAKKNMDVFRTLRVDGAVPFRELLSVKFPYAAGWQEIRVQDEEGEPYAIPLTAGRHDISLTVNFTPYVPVVAGIEGVSAELRAVAAELRAITGGKEDPYRLWDVEREAPGITDRLRGLKREYERLVAMLEEINGTRNEVSGAFLAAIEDIDDLLRRPNDIPNKTSRIVSLGAVVEEQRERLIEGPLALDKIALVPEGTPFPRFASTWLERAGGAAREFLLSFRDRGAADASGDEPLTVWMLWGRDYVEELQRLADERFTPETGIRVDIRLIREARLLTMASSAGNTPDVALGLPGDMPFDLALRNMAVDLSALPGADGVLQGYHPGALLPYFYKGGYYGLPETNNMKVLFYRKDILEQLGLKPPDTWEDVYDMLPMLLQQNYSFYIEPADFSYFFFQNGAEMYAPDGRETALSQPEAFRAFRQWTEMFTVYGLEKQVQSFYNQFRKGYMPVGISDFGTYVQLLAAAPELRGAWGIAPVPGTRQEDGTVARWSGGASLVSSSGMLLKSGSPEREAKAWSFLRWYMSEEAQTDYGLALERKFGEQVRWNSGNVAAFANMPWGEEDLDAILEQWRWIKDLPNVPGGYMTPREIQNAWTRTVVGGADLRKSLERSVREIDRELSRKQREFGWDEADGASTALPRVDAPWEGAMKYAE